MAILWPTISLLTYAALEGRRGGNGGGGERDDELGCCTRLLSGSLGRRVMVNPGFLGAAITSLWEGAEVTPLTREVAAAAGT